MTVGEGGIRTPFIMTGPGIPEGERHTNFAYVTDIMPTILDMLNIEKSDSFNGKDVLAMSGKSMSKVFSGEKESVYDSNEYVAGEMGNGKWVRKGFYKAAKVVSPYGNGTWELYDVSIDPGETTNLADQHPEKLEELKAAWEKYAKDVGVILTNQK